MRLLAPVVTGLVVFAALFPFAGSDTQPPTCWSVLGYVVPCGAGVAVGAGLAAAVLAAVVDLLRARRSR